MEDYIIIGILLATIVIAILRAKKHTLLHLELSKAFPS